MGTSSASEPTKAVSSSPLTVLRHRGFATMWGASVVSDCGTWMQSVTVGVLVAKLTGQATATGLVGVAAFAMQGIGAPIGGVLADRYDRRRLFLRALAMQTVVTIVLAFVLAKENPKPGVLAALIALQGLSGAFGMPAAQAMMPSLVPRDELTKASGLGAISWNAGRILGAGFAALLGLWLAPAWIVVINAATFAGMYLAVASLRGTFRADGPSPTGSLVRQFRDGASALWAVPGCRFALAMMVYLQLTLVPWVGLIPIVAQERLHGTRSLANLMITVQGVGAVLGAIAVSWVVAVLGRPRAIVLSSVVSSAALLGYAQSTNRYVAFPFVFVLGFASVGLFVSVGSMFQRDAPEHVRARVMSIQQASLGVCFGLGVLVAGRLSDRYGLGIVHSACALVFGGGVLASVGLLRSQWAVVGRGDSRPHRATR